MFEFILLLALMISILAMSTDIILPAVDFILADIPPPHPNDAHQLFIFFFFGFGLGQALFGPLSDAYGRKKLTYVGYAIFVLSCALAIFAPSFEWMLIARFAMGFGAAAPRIVSLALVRDLYEGREMARIMSFVMSVFILVPMLAPLIGQGLLLFSTWHSTFLIAMVSAVIAWLWFGLRQPETLSVSNRRAFTFSNLAQGFVFIIKQPLAVGYTIAAGFIFGAFLGYLATAQKIFQHAFGLGGNFVFFFSGAALMVGLSSMLNSQLVMRLGMRLLVKWSLIAVCVIAVLFFPILLMTEGLPNIWFFMAWLCMTFFCVGLLFGNLNALAMLPLGGLSGLGAALCGSISTLISLPIAGLIGELYDDTLFPLVTGFLVLGALALATMLVTERAAAKMQAASQK